MRRVRVLGVALVLLLVVGTWGVLSSNAALATDVTQVALVKATFGHAMSTRESVTVPNDGAGQTVALTAAAARTMISAGELALAQVFTPTAVQQEMNGLRNAVSAEGDANLLVTGAGASDVAFKGVSVDGSTATVHAHVRTWSTFASRQSGTSRWVVSRPSNVLDTTARLTRDAGGRWRVSSLSWGFVPGTGP